MSHSRNRCTSALHPPVKHTSNWSRRLNKKRNTDVDSLEITSLETQLFSLSTPLSTSILFDGRQKMNKYLGGFPRSYSLAWHYRPDPARRLIGGDEEVECLPKNLNVIKWCNTSKRFMLALYSFYFGRTNDLLFFKLSFAV